MDHGCAPSPEFAFAHLVVELLLIRVYHERILELERSIGELAQ